MNSKTYRLAVVAGDGIGPEVVTEALKVMRRAGELFDYSLDENVFDFSAERYLATGHIISAEEIADLADNDAILFGALGDPRVEPGILERGLILRVRSELDLAVNVRPVRLYPGVVSPMRTATADNCDLVILRENLEGMYSSGGTTLSRNGKPTVALQESINTRQTVQRLMDFGCRLASRRRSHLTLCHKTNILVHAGALYEDVLGEVSADYPDVNTGYVHADALCQHLPMSPGKFDVIVTDNLFGDIISDLGATIQGGLGIASSANLNVDGTAPSMFEAVHGSAPDIAGKSLANPCAQILSGALGLAWLGEVTAAEAVEAAVADVLTEMPIALDGTGEWSTPGVGDKVVAALEKVVEQEVPELTGSLMGALNGMTNAAQVAA